MKISLFRSLVFKILIIYALVFLISLGFLLLSTHTFFKSTLESQFKDHIYNDFKHLITDYRDDGIDELRHDIKERRDAEVDRRLFYFLFNPDGFYEFDIIEALPESDGWHYAQLSGNVKIILYKETLKEGFKLAVGSDLLYLEELDDQITDRLIKLFLILLTLGATTGYFLTKYLFNRLNEIKQVAESFSNGDFSKRVIVKNDDELGLIETVINDMLSKIEKLFYEIKNVTTNLAHDLRTPLGRVRIKLEETLNLNNSDPEVAKKIEEALLQIDELHTTFNSLLSLSEITNSKPLNMQPFSLTETIFDIQEIYAPLIEESGNQLTIDSPHNLMLYGDKALITQLIVNLIENSINHNTKNVQLNIKVESEGHTTLLRISDDGQGIPPEEFENIFKPFYTIDHNRGSKGNGLGLSIVKAIAELHQADIIVSNPHPRGINFTFRFKGR